MVSTETFDPSTVFAEMGEDVVSPILAVWHADDLAFELGVWLASLESFLNTGGSFLAGKSRTADATRDWKREYRLTHSVLIICSKLNLRLQQISGSEGLADDVRESDGMSRSDLGKFGRLLHEAIVTNEGFNASRNLTFADWSSWSSSLLLKLRSSPSFTKFVRRSNRSSEDHLPETLKNLVTNHSVPFTDEADLKLVLPRFASIIKSLSIVGRMLRDDEPLKPTLLIFSKIQEEIQDLVTHINNRLSRFPDEEAALFGSLDGAAYTASLELKKVYQQELIGIVGVRPAPTIYARIETAYSLLNDGFQHILTGFARVIDPNVKNGDLFPAFNAKLEHSLQLRQHLWKLLQSVRSAEQDPNKDALAMLKTDFETFLAQTMSYLFYKDKETVERFGEEVLATSEKKDLVPILHRCGAYLETLLGQVNMRSVLADHPFEPGK
ncbi:MAG TPA: hypothetical protein VJL58_09305 [Pyrinomonadaceae bacterium]|nr:hypothetical protein [Pyrinomonadaceae bacterium]